MTVTPVIQNQLLEVPIGIIFL